MWKRDAGELRIERRRASRSSGASAAVLDALPLALLVVDREMRVAWASSHALRLRPAGDPFATAAGRLVVRSEARAELESILSTAWCEGEAAGTVGSTSRATPLIVRATRLPGDAEGGAILLQLTDREVPPLIDPDVARQIFALTAVEAKLAALIAEGASLSRAAATLRISTGTARNHLKSIFRKTEVGRQSDLVRLLLTTSSAWNLRP